MPQQFWKLFLQDCLSKNSYACIRQVDIVQGQPRCVAEIIRTLCTTNFEGDKKEVTKVRKSIGKTVEAIDRKLHIHPLSKKPKIDLHITEIWSKQNSRPSLMYVDPQIVNTVLFP